MMNNTGYANNGYVNVNINQIANAIAMEVQKQVNEVIKQLVRDVNKIMKDVKEVTNKNFENMQKATINLIYECLIENISFMTNEILSANNKNTNLNGKTRQISDEDIQRIKDLRRNGYSYAKIRKETKWSTCTISRVLHGEYEKDEILDKDNRYNNKISIDKDKLKPPKNNKIDCINSLDTSKDDINVNDNNKININNGITINNNVYYNPTNNYNSTNNYTAYLNTPNINNEAFKDRLLGKDNSQRYIEIKEYDEN